ncbi:MAG: stage 0 sporulation protein [Nitrospinae bacterium RIFCSPLOWO2_02_FULL_39_110]|nr:MAG: stage 0 sporulation protein [Nitrospinae bacterium RIFCSPHIGHO2_02_39_11]OGW00058.1 MAG: stage 0 sporulation protein [Nitrospinae bacterium RIFCSPHIGHO2_12_FULL_39_42]OGW01461.1 MAG: stage 0 sporulation protein [Nitrospinae bacterium RIFCSPHIGHO2_02_FULL_39_82]OGW03621.1 MAG: stage 0 sporulation protein [Nitrospinae bacterium RIFCSPLOWO2_02_39_17]OGW05838.1 MAG: stage 0 sporulation protein [Nitrospinae bacterium RIFCSPLOWO2_02_FULL_39_110]OGW09786.1 MAG: stage 0 sporulation protein [Ni
MTDSSESDTSIFVVGVRFKSSGRVNDFKSDGLLLMVGDRCIVETEKGLEFGIVAMARRKIPEDLIQKTLRGVVRKATEEDLKQIENNEAMERKAFEMCQNRIQELELKMKLVRVDFSFDVQKSVFYFIAEERVDFRELVKDMAHHFNTKIEMKQIGFRDEARILGGCGPCGRNLCCASFLKDFEPVSIKMAKDQNLALNPLKISGVCGRLMCCLAYEHETYKELQKNLPKIGKVVDTKEGKGKIIQINLLQENAVIELEDGKRVMMDIKEINQQ